MRLKSSADVTTTLTTLIIQMISSRSNLLDSFVVLYATLVGSLHRIVGMEFGRSSNIQQACLTLNGIGAHFLHTLVMQYRAAVPSSTSKHAPLAATIYETPDASKESLNLLVLITELYNAHVVSSKLVYDLIRGFLGSGRDEEAMGEREVEGLLKILRCMSDISVKRLV